MTTTANASSSLNISCVVYDTDYTILATTIESLKVSLDIAIEKSVLSNYTFSLINNQNALTQSFQQAANLSSTTLTEVEIISGHGNIGYGKANNLSIHKTNQDFHLILNPDVKLDSQALYEGLTFLIANPDVGLVAPNAFNEDNQPEYLCKRMPTPLIIFLRGLNNSFLNKLFKKNLDWYTYKDKFPTDKPMEIELASGCFMLCRTQELQRIGGFSPKYFLYFEDFDLSRRIAKKVFLPSMCIIHLGGKAASKGFKHIKFFLTSYLIFLRG